MKSIGIKLADGTFYPIMEEGKAQKKSIDLTTVQDKQTIVHVDLYRSATNSMEDAEYIDTLEIKNLKPHQNGEPDLNLDISLDENNELSAEIVDRETGIKSETQVTLISRTLAERNESPISFENDPTLSEQNLETEDNTIDPYENTIANDFEKSVELVDENVSLVDDSFTISPEEVADIGLADINETKTEEKEMIGPSPNDEDFTFDSLNEDILQNQEIESEPIENAENIFSDQELEVPNFEHKEEKSEDENIIEEQIEEPIVEENNIYDDETPVTEEEINVPVFDEVSNNNEDISENDNLSALNDFDLDSSEDSASDDMSSLSDFDLDSSDDSTSDDMNALSDFDLDSSDDTTSDDMNALNDFDLGSSDDSTSDDMNALNDFDLDSSDDTASDDMNALSDFDLDSSDDTASDDMSALNDFDLDSSDDTTSDEIAQPAVVGLNGFFDEDYGEPDLNNSDLDVNAFDTSDLDDPIDFDSEEPTTKDPTFQPNTNMFSDLYDKETISGTSYSYNEDSDDIKKKTKTPVIICIICAIICIIGALLVLFVIPSKMNVLKKHNADKVQIEETDEPIADLTEEEIPLENESDDLEIEIEVEETEQVPAQEDTIVVVEEPEQIVPEVPTPVEKKEDIKYKIIWGDTLWDISNAYYKNPWKYKFLAKYNGIKNPDHIISGTWILIPAE